MHSIPGPVQVALVFMVSMGLAGTLGGPTIGILKRIGAGQRVRDDGPQRHLQKEGTPTMGGVFLLTAALATAIAADRWFGGAVRLPIVVLAALTAAFAAIGAADDWRKIRRGRSLGLRAREKLALQVIAAAAFAYALLAHRLVESLSPDVAVDPMRIPTAVFWVLAVVATSNAVNMADGLDGLAAGLCAMAGIGFAVLSALSGQREVTVFALALVGACAGFLLFNVHPAKVFMGDVGSLALGAALAGMAAWLDRPVALIGLCLVPFAEELSVIAQVVSFKTTGKRVLRMSPLHHHFELAGWSERRVVWTFWAVGAAAAAVTVVGAMR